MPVENDSTTLGTDELRTQFDADPLSFYRGVAAEMQERGVEDAPTWSRALEFVSPTEGNGPDAFTRLMRAHGIRTQSDPAAGYWASRASDFRASPATRALMQEYFARTWRRHVYRQPQQRAQSLSTDDTVGNWARPYADAAVARWDQQIAPAIGLNELVGMTTPVDGQDFRAYFLTYNAESLRMFRVGESADIPVADIGHSERPIQLKKYGRRLRASYESLRRIRVDKLARMIAQMAVQSEIDKVAAALDIIINGDGNAGTAPTTHNLTTLDTAASAGTLTIKGWLAFKMKFTNPYTITGALMQEAVALQLALLNTGSANVPLVSANLGGLGTGLTPINQFADGVRFGWTADAPALKIVGFDRRSGLEQAVEIGSSIAESERYITNQTEEMTMTEVNGFAVADANAHKILDVNA